MGEESDKQTIQSSKVGITRLIFFLICQIVLIVVVILVTGLALTITSLSGAIGTFLIFGTGTIATILAFVVAPITIVATAILSFLAVIGFVGLAVVQLLIAPIIYYILSIILSMLFLANVYYSFWRNLWYGIIWPITWGKRIFGGKVLGEP